MIKRILPRGLMARSLLILMVPIVIVQVITTIVFFDNHWRRVTSRLAFAVAGEVALVSDMIETGAWDAATIKKRFDFKINIPPRDYTDGAKIEPYRFWENYAARELAKELKNQMSREFTLESHFDQKKILINTEIAEQAVQFVIPERRLFSSSGYIVILWMMGASVLMLMIAVVFMRNQIKPIRRLAIAAERFGKGGDTPGFKPAGAREVRRAAQAFVDMRDRIKRQIEQRTLMLAGVSHDLRTPLTRMKLQIELMPDSAEKEAMKRDVRDMNRMIDGYLNFARGTADEAAGFTNISELVRQIIEQYSAQIDCITANIQEGVYLMLKPMAIQRCISNIIGNAIRFGEQAYVDVYESDKTCFIHIDDNGPGIEQDVYDEVFKPFYRGDPARSSSDGHVGLGLSIAQDIVYSHGGRIDLQPSEKGGLKVIIALPM